MVAVAREHDIAAREREAEPPEFIRRGLSLDPCSELRLHRGVFLALLVTGTATYALFLVLLPLLVGTPWLWALTFLGGAGGALIYLPALGYLQDLLGRRAGAGASLLALQRLSSDGLTAAIYAFGAWAAGYWLVAVLGAAATLAAITTVAWLDRARPLPGVKVP